MNKIAKLTLFTGFALTGVSQAVITVQRHYTFNDNTTPVGLTEVNGPASYSGGSLTVNNLNGAAGGQTYLTGSSGVTGTTNYGLEVIVTATTFEDFDFVASLTGNNTNNEGVGLFANATIANGYVAFATSAIGGALNPNQEYRLAFVRDTTAGVSTNSLYVDGVLAGTSTSTPIGGLDTLSVGSHPFAAANNFGSWSGSVNEVRTFTFNEGEFQVTDLLQVASVPEPSSVTLLGLGGLALVLRRKK